MGQNHARVLADISNLIGVADTSKENAEKIAERFNTTAYTDIEAFLKMDELEAVSIATPTVTHYELAKIALNHGKHVIVEKPMCATIEEGQELIKLAREKGLTLAVGLIERHNPVVKFTKDLLGTDGVGNVINLSSRRVSSYPARIRDVGVIFDLGIHDMDTLRYLVGAEVVSVYSLGGKSVNPDFEDHAYILVGFDNGITGAIEVNWLTPMKVRKVDITCSESFVEMDYAAQSTQISSSKFMDLDTANFYRIPQKYDIRRMVLRPEEPLKNELDDFLCAIEEDKPPLVTGEDGLMVLNVANCAVLSLKEGRRIEVTSCLP